MGCSNALMIRYMVQIAPGACNNFADLTGLIAANTDTKQSKTGIVPGVTRVTGLALGEEGSIEVPEWETKSIISDGKRALPTLGLQARVDADLRGFTLFSGIFNERAAATLDFKIFICKRNWDPLYAYYYKDCEIRGFNQEDQELGASKLGLVDMVFAPYNVFLLKADGSSYYVEK